MTTAQPPIQCLALDIGGVFHGDSWETIFERELAPAFNLDMPTIHKYGATIWDNHAHKVSTADAYWRDWEQALGRVIDHSQISQWIERHVWVDHSVAELVKRCIEHKIDVAIVSNNTSFWYEDEMRRAGLGPYIKCVRVFNSYTTGYPKAHAQGGLTLLAREYAPSSILFVDDRAENIERAVQLGMRTMLYERNLSLPLNDYVSPILFTP